MTQNLSSTCKTNMSDILMLSVIHLEHVHTLEVIPGTPPILDFKIKENLLPNITVITNIKPDPDTSSVNWLTSKTSAGTSIDISVIITIPYLKQNHSFFSNKNIDHPFALYIIDANFQVWLIGTLHSPLYLVKSENQLSSQNQNKLTFEAQLFESPMILLTSATPHFLSIPSHSFTPDFYNFD